MPLSWYGGNVQCTQEFICMAARCSKAYANRNWPISAFCFDPGYYPTMNERWENNKKWRAMNQSSLLAEKRCSIFGSYRIIWLTRLKSEVSAGARKKKRNKDIYHCSRSEKNGINKGIFMSCYKSIAFNKITWDFGNISRISSNMKKLNEQHWVYFST